MFGMASGEPGWSTKLNEGVGPGVAVSVDWTKMGVAEGSGVLVGRGVLVAVGSSVGSGVQVGGSSLREVGVAEGTAKVGGRVGGAKGFNDVFGLIKIIK